MTELSPQGVLEECFATEIMKSVLRLRRCRNIEFDLAESTELDPMLDEHTSNHQKTVDRARTQSHFLLRHSLIQLSKLQTARTIRLQLEANDAGLGQTKEKETTQPKPAATSNSINDASRMDALATLTALADQQLCQQYRESGLSSFCNPVANPVSDPVGQIPDLPPATTSFCNSTLLLRNGTQAIGSKVPRNAPRPCGSNAKLKNAVEILAAPEVKPVLDKAA